MPARSSPPRPASPIGQTLVFAVLAFLLSWPLWFAVILGRLPLTPFGSFAPSLAAVVLTGIWIDRQGLTDLARALGRWRAPFLAYGVALLGPVAAHLATILLTSGLADLKPEPVAIPWFVFALAPVEILVLGGPLGEEIGWRGFALPRLLQRFGPLPASLVLAAIWILWHLPLYFIPKSAQADIPFGYFAATLVAYSVVLTWLYLRSQGSLLLAILFHTSANTSFFLVQTLFPRSLSAPGYGRWFVALALAGAALAAIALVRPERKADSRKPD